MIRCDPGCPICDAGSERERTAAELERARRLLAAGLDVLADLAERLERPTRHS